MDSPGTSAHALQVTAIVTAAVILTSGVSLGVFGVTVDMYQDKTRPVGPKPRYPLNTGGRIACWLILSVVESLLVVVWLCGWLALLPLQVLTIPASVVITISQLVIERITGKTPESYLCLDQFTKATFDFMIALARKDRTPSWVVEMCGGTKAAEEPIVETGGEDAAEPVPDYRDAGVASDIWQTNDGRWGMGHVTEFVEEPAPTYGYREGNYGGGTPPPRRNVPRIPESHPDSDLARGHPIHDVSSYQRWN